MFFKRGRSTQSDRGSETASYTVLSYGRQARAEQRAERGHEAGLVGRHYEGEGSTQFRTKMCNEDTTTICGWRLFLFHLGFWSVFLLLLLLLLLL